MKKLLQILFATAAVAVALQPAISRAEFAKGEVLSHHLSVCLEEKDAIEIVQTHVDKGREAAEAMWQSKGRCATVPVWGYRVGETVHSAKVVMEDGTTKIARVIQIKGQDNRVIGYFLTTQPLKKERDS